MDLLSLALSLSLPMNEGRFTGDARLDVNPVVAVPMDGLPWGAAAITLPGVVLYDDRGLWGPEYDLPSSREMRAHELGHADQQSTLGPAFWLVYLLSAGRAFEPYDSLSTTFGLPSSHQGSPHDMSRTWQPPSDMPRQFPFLRLERKGGTTSIQLLPGYPGIQIQR